MKRNVRYSIEFWSILALAVTAEWWMDLVCRVLI